MSDTGLSVHTKLRAPFPWFGGKSRVAHVVWERFGDVAHYVEPFAGSLAVLLNRPHAPQVETVNDKDAYIVNFWRAVTHAPQEVAKYADYPVTSNDLTARHIWLVNQTDLVAKIEGDPSYFDAKIAGWWCWGICAWIGGEWCSGKGPWQAVDGLAVQRQNGARGVSRRRCHLSGAGMGVHRPVDIHGWFEALQARLRRVRVCCGDWTQVCRPAVVGLGKTCGVFLDPPYSSAAGRDPNLYAVESLSVANDVRDWAIEHGDNPRLRIALCGYEGEHEMPGSWSEFAWKTSGGMALTAKSASSRGKLNRFRERIWFSPHCLPAPHLAPAVPAEVARWQR